MPYQSPRSLAGIWTQAEKIAYALEYFTKKAPDILKNIQGVVSQLDARKFASVLREELKKATDEMTSEF